MRAYHEIFGSVKRKAGVSNLDWKNHLFCQVLYISVACSTALLEIHKFIPHVNCQAMVIADLCAWGTGGDLFDALEQCLRHLDGVGGQLIKKKMPAMMPPTTSWCFCLFIIIKGS